MTSRTETIPRNQAKIKLNGNRPVIGSWITLAHPAIAEILASAGFDWLAVDLEHSVITLRETEELIRVIALAGVTPLVRLSSNDPVQIKRVMDAGAQGIIVPMVNSSNEAERAVAAARYPAAGTRGVGLARAQKYGFGFEEYRKWQEKNVLVVVQIEHIDAVENLVPILSTPGVDAFIVGPYDLSASLGLPGQFTHPKVQAAFKEIQRVAQKLDFPAGIHVIRPDIQEARERLREGYRFLAYSLDILMLGTMAREGAAALRGSKKTR